MIISRITLVLVFLLISAGCSSVKLPAITDTPTNSSLPGKVVWHDLITDTPEESKRFYQELFGWQFEEVGIGSSSSINYTLIRLNGRLIGGMVDQTRLQTRVDISQWISLISVPDVDAAADSLLAAGGTVITAPVDVADRGRLAVVADPQGALFSLLQTNSRDPLDRDEVDPGGFLWNELWTEDVDAASGFYMELMGYTPEDDPELQQAVAARGNYRILESHGHPRVGIMKNPIEGLNPIWVNYLRVKDADSLDAIAARVEALGGTLLLAPQDRDIGGRVALIAGPSGAGIALQTWPVAKEQ
jgi:predicted enzyme related to lactoylglutathione lyase